METKTPSSQLFRSQLSKQPKKQALNPYLHKQSFFKDKAGLKINNSTLKKPEFKMPLTPNLAKPVKKVLDLKVRERGKSINYSANAFQKMLKENTKEPTSYLNSSKIKNPTRSCIPSPNLNRSREEVIQPLQEKKIIQEGCHRRNQSMFIQPIRDKEKEKILQNPPIKEKKRVKILRIDRFVKVQEPQLPENEYYQNQLFIMNPVVEQELFKEYLGTDKQTFGFEKLILSGNCNIPPIDNEAINPRMINETVFVPKSTKADPKQRIITKDSSNTIAGMTTNSTSRYKRTLGFTSGLSDRENGDLVELIEWSSDTERFFNMKSPQAQNVIFEETNFCDGDMLSMQQLKPPKKQQIKPAITPSALKSELGKYAAREKEKAKLTKDLKKKEQNH